MRSSRAGRAWAFFCDPYYLVYCAMLALVYVGFRLVTVTSRREAAAGVRRHVVRALDLLDGHVAALIVGVHVVGGGLVQIASISISMRTLYTPMLVLTVLARPGVLTPAARARLAAAAAAAPFIRLAVAALIAAAVILSPTLYAMARRAAQGRTVPRRCCGVRAHRASISPPSFCPTRTIR